MLHDYVAIKLNNLHVEHIKLRYQIIDILPEL